MEPVDRRHLRAPFALWLLGRGWDEREVAQACGDKRTRSLMALVEPVREGHRQVEKEEFLDLASRRGAESLRFRGLSPLAEARADVTAGSTEG